MRSEPTVKSYPNDDHKPALKPGVCKVRIKSKSLKMGKNIKGWKRRENKILEEFTLLAVPKDSI